MKNKVLLPFSITGNATWFAHYLQFPKVQIETKEHFVKQSYRSRFTILGANGPLDLIVPILHGRKERVPMDQVHIAYHHNWQREQWQSLVSAYRSSPYFEYFEADIEPIWHTEHERLMERNTALLAMALELMQEPVRHSLTDIYEKPVDALDLREAISPKRDWPTKGQFPKYPQVFEDRHPFIPDLSILDLLFNLGPRASEYLRALPLQLP